MLSQQTRGTGPAQASLWVASICSSQFRSLESSQHPRRRSGTPGNPVNI